MISHQVSIVPSRTVRFLLLGLIFQFFVIALHPVSAQTKQKKKAPPDSLWTLELPVMVVTATRTPRSLRDVPIPTRVVMADQIREQGALRVSDLLSEQTGLVLVDDFGSGIQIQGFDSAYSLVLIDGEPVIGRTAGTLDLDRLPVANIDRIEIVEGPSSSIYGSEALAGVINIITRRPTQSFSARSSLRLESHATTDLNTSVEASSARGGLRLAFDRLGTNGYDLSPDVIGLTSPGYQNYTLSTRASYELFDRLAFNLSGRYSNQDQRNTIGFDQAGTRLSFEEKAVRTDWSVSPSAEWKFSPAFRLKASGHFANYINNSNFQDASGPSRIHFEQTYRKGELLGTVVLGTKHLISAGGGFIQESVAADRVAGGLRKNYNVYGFFQHQFFPSKSWEVNLSARLDAHSDYDTRFSPKAALMWKASETTRVRASVGTGFKAPSFQQLYMDFTNPVAGYSVVGASDIATALDRFEQTDQIQFYLTDPASFSTILPENSISYNISAEADLSNRLYAEVHFFLNNVRDLIETLPVAAKPNGQNIFSYTNLNRIFTRGVNAEVRYSFTENLSGSVGYQFLDARDRNVLKQLDAGRLFTRKNGIDRRLTRSDYGGLFNRSRHSGVLRLTYREPESGLTIALRGIYRSRYGFGDLNGNLILDDEREYVRGYSTWNVTVSRPVSERFDAQFGIRNAFGITNPEFIPSLSGRLYFAGLSVSI
jgi:outer membrane receptor for ferrienterochelin and colicins